MEGPKQGYVSLHRRGSSNRDDRTAFEAVPSPRVSGLVAGPPLLATLQWSRPDPIDQEEYDP